MRDVTFPGHSPFLPTLICGRNAEGNQHGVIGASTSFMRQSRVSLEGFLLEASSPSVVCGTEQ